jgi:hypothetical protein
MMKRFKVGAHVVCVDPGTFTFLTEGKTYVVIPDDRASIFGSISANHTVCVVNDNGASVTLNYWRFEDAPEEFNISTASDQELADEYRRRLENLYEVGHALQDRGFEIRVEEGGLCPHKNIKRTITKKEIKEIVL